MFWKTQNRNIIIFDLIMIIYGDYHTHTTYSHGKGSIIDNAIAAKNKGLK